MIENIGICNTINWDSIIQECENTVPEFVGPSHKRGDTVTGLDPILDMWDNAGYQLASTGGTVVWDMFIPGKQFDERIIETFANFYCIEIENAWISRIHPGKFAPMHWDVNDNEDAIGDRLRWHCHIGKPSWGHIFIVEDTCLYNQQQGQTYKWNSRRAWHAGTNCGLTPKYILNLW